MSTTPANAQGLASFKRTMVTQYDGTCTWCGSKTTKGVDFFSFGYDGSKVSTCTSCALSVPARISGIVGAIGKVQDQLTEEQLCQLPDFPANLEDAIYGRCGDAEMEIVTTEVLALRHQVEALIKAAAAAAPKADDDPRIAALRAVLSAVPAKDQSFAQSLVDQYDKRGDLSDRQWPWVDKLAAKAAAAAAPAIDPAPFGVYVFDNGDVWRIYKTQNGRRGARQFDGTTFNYVQGGSPVVDKAVADGVAHQLTEDEAATWGIANDLCFNCISMGMPGYLTDDRSLAAGYGETCARNNGWRYPSAAEAAEILRDREACNATHSH